MIARFRAIIYCQNPPPAIFVNYRTAEVINLTIFYIKLTINFRGVASFAIKDHEVHKGILSGLCCFPSTFIVYYTPKMKLVKG